MLPQLVTNAAFASLSGHAQQIPKHGTAAPQTEVPSLALCTSCAGCVHELVCGLLAVVFSTTWFYRASVLSSTTENTCLPIVCLSACLTRHSGSISFVSARGTQRTPSSQNQTCPLPRNTPQRHKKGPATGKVCHASLCCMFKIMPYFNVSTCLALLLLQCAPKACGNC